MSPQLPVLQEKPTGNNKILQLYTLKLTTRTETWWRVKEILLYHKVEE